MLFVCTFVLGVIAGLRSMTPLAAVSWASHLGWIHLENTPLAFLGYSATPYILSLLAILELINDKLPKTPSRKSPPIFAARLVTGAFSGAAFGMAHNATFIGLIAGVLGAVAGTYGGYEFRVRLVKTIGGKDLPIALLEDLIAIAGAFFIVTH